MALNACRHHHDNDNDNNNNNNNNVSDDAFEDLENNVGRVVTVFTSSGGCSGRGFTGLLVEANDDFIKLVTCPPTAPRHPLGLAPTSLFGGPGCAGRLGTSCVIPTNKIVCYAFNQL